MESLRIQMQAWRSRFVGRVSISPYHYRLDWQIWFAAMSSPDQYPWTLHLVWKLLHNDVGALTC